MLFEKNQTVAKLPTWLGTKIKVDAVTNQQIELNVPGEKPLESVNIRVKYESPLYAPIAKGAKVAKLIIEVKGYKTFEYSLFAKESVDKVGYLRRMNRILRYKIKNFSK